MPKSFNFALQAWIRSPAKSLGSNTIAATSAGSTTSQVNTRPANQAMTSRLNPISEKPTENDNTEMLANRNRVMIDDQAQVNLIHCSLAGMLTNLRFADGPDSHFAVVCNFAGVFCVLVSEAGFLEPPCRTRSPKLVLVIRRQSLRSG